MAVVDQIRRPQASTQLRWQAQVVDSEHFARSFAEAPDRVGPVTFQPLGVLFEFCHALIGIEFPGGIDRRLCLVMLILRQVSQNISLLVIATATGGL